jgi:ribosomal protein S18 acetylase RimI-like enzyme
MTAAANPPPRLGTPPIRVLTAADVPALRLDGGGRIGEAALRRVLVEYPGRSVWMPASLEFALLAPWRHRDEIALVQELDAAAHGEALLAAAVERCRATGVALTLVIEVEDRRRPGFYAGGGLEPIEEVITYELGPPIPAAARSGDNGGLAFERVLPGDAIGMAELGRIDHAAFPWLWWNSEAEFAVYAATVGVRLFLVREGRRAVGYLGITSYPGWGHLDRIAVDPGLYGRGYGRRLLTFAVATLVAAGARRIALSTQRANVRSQRLYERAGFRRSPGFDYRLYGAALRAPAPGLTASLNGRIDRDDG